ncbi:MAG: molybdopterin-guanine dinucleotide biosynthesis protein [Glaciihabitans sp.]|nr:molybdopterin-guanine dinucleotide biosynthesis protein [Glaciihabitans sp.]
MTDPTTERTISEWSERLTQALQILDLKIDHGMLLELAERSSKTVVQEAGPISTFVVGYAAGLAATSGEKEANAAVKTAANTAMLVVEAEEAAHAPADAGWTETAQ